jgi:ferritin
MKTNRLSTSIQDALNKQVTNEAEAAQLYIAFAAWASGEGYAGISNFLFRHANEERGHMMKIVAYILERGANVKVETIPAPGEPPTSIQNCFEQVLKQEVSNTKAIFKIVKMSFDAEDWATWHFMQWFVNEQTEEETLSLNLLDKIKIAGGANATNDALYILDKDLQRMSDHLQLAERKIA